jgi:KDO2-lipid IV(A) lauroyltransferase
MRFLFFGFMRFMALWPLSALRALGFALGWVLWHLAHKRRHIAQTNLQLCFPEKTAEDIRQIARDHFIYFAQSLLDRTWLWHAPLALVACRLHWSGSEQAFAQLNASSPRLVFAPHFVGLDAGGLALIMRLTSPASFIFVPQRNALLEQWVNEGRQRAGNVKAYFRHEGVKQMISGLRQGELLHLSPDMDFGPQESEFVPFMGVMAATVPSLSRFARLGRAPVLMMVTRMTPQGYTLELSDAWDDFPTDDVMADTQRMNNELEAAIRRSPAQYYWVHKRFKTRPEGEADVYKNASISR